MSIPFKPSAKPGSVGIEWELMLVDQKTRYLAQKAPEVLADPRVNQEIASNQGFAKVKAELMRNTVEVITEVCDTVKEASNDLAKTVAIVRSASEELGLTLMCSGIHPISHWQDQEVTNKARYHQMLDHGQWMVRRMAINGVHTHVGLTRKDHVIPILNGLNRYVPIFLALSASSPFRNGYDTGLASSRSQVFETLPASGLPPYFKDWNDYESQVEIMLATESIFDKRGIWWDVRPHPDFGTMEFRICDGLPTLEEVEAVAALAQCLTTWLDQKIEKGYTFPVLEGWIAHENKWRAARYGLDAHLIANNQGNLVRVKDAIVKLIADLMPTAHQLQCVEELSRIERILSVGASYQRQRAVAAASGGDLISVVDSLVAEMRDGLYT